MRPILQHVILLFVIAILFIGCEKSQVTFNPESLENTQWMPTMVDENISSNPAGDNRYYPWQDCRMDDHLIFSDNSWSFDSNNTRCTVGSGSEWQVSSIPYSFDSSKMELTLQNENGSLQIKVYEYTTERLKLGYAIPSATGFTNVILLFKRTNLQ